ncbi:GMC oxidoreductase-like protein 1 [Elsinoe fawcettii]|nr:GMC oxidoreductase-like protein 1 [Elsinoe fawcettii]
MASLLFSIPVFACIAFCLPLNSPILPEYDYIIVGGGASGLTVANRLSEDPSVNVLVIEAGQADIGQPSVRSPFLAGQNIRTPYDWNITTAPQLNLDGKARYLTQGRTESYFAGLSRRQQIPAPSAQELDAFGYSGPVQISYPVYAYNQSSSILAGLNELGLPSMADISSGDMSGAAILPLTVDPSTNERSDARTAYLDPFLERPNLNIVTGQTATQILFEQNAPNSSSSASIFNGTTTASIQTPLQSVYRRLVDDPTSGAPIGSWSWRARQRFDKPHLVGRQFAGSSRVSSLLRALGVEIAGNVTSLRRNITATREVIMAAGAIKTPQILKLSGIGQRQELQNKQIAVRIDLAGVGSNLQDHYQLSLTYPVRFSRYSSAGLMQDIPEETLSSFSVGPQEAIVLPPLAQVSNRTTQLTAVIQSQSISEYLYSATDTTIITGYQAQRTLILEAILSTTRTFWEMIGSNEGGWAIVNRRPLSRGTLNSSSPFAVPIVDPRYGANPVDLELLVESVMFANRLFMTSPFRSSNTTSLGKVLSLINMQAITELIVERVQTSCNLVGTAAMLPLDLGGVVDSQLLVYGTSNLRVVDASIMPLIPASNLQAIVYAVAEKAADLIKSSRLGFLSGSLPASSPVVSSSSAGSVRIASTAGIVTTRTRITVAPLQQSRQSSLPSTSSATSAPSNTGPILPSVSSPLRIDGLTRTTSFAAASLATTTTASVQSSSISSSASTLALLSQRTSDSPGLGSARSTILATFGTTGTGMIILIPGSSQPAASLSLSNTGLTRSTIFGTFGTTGTGAVFVDVPTALGPSASSTSSQTLVIARSGQNLVSASVVLVTARVSPVALGTTTSPAVSVNTSDTASTTNITGTFQQTQRSNISSAVSSSLASTILGSLIIRTIPSGLQLLNGSNPGCTSRCPMPVYVTTVWRTVMTSVSVSTMSHLSPTMTAGSLSYPCTTLTLVTTSTLSIGQAGPTVHPTTVPYRVSTVVLPLVLYLSHQPLLQASSTYAVVNQTLAHLTTATSAIQQVTLPAPVPDPGPASLLGVTVTTFTSNHPTGPVTITSTVLPGGSVLTVTSSHPTAPVTSLTTLYGQGTGSGIVSTVTSTYPTGISVNNGSVDALIFARLLDLDRFRYKQPDHNHDRDYVVTS